jgi:hypothetical protein
LTISWQAQNAPVCAENPRATRFDWPLISGR